MKKYINQIFILVFLFMMFSCATAPPSEAIFIKNYKHRIVRVDPISHGRIVTVKVHHTGALSRAESDDLIRWYKNKHRDPHHQVKVVFIRH